MAELLKKDLHWILLRTPKPVITALQSYPAKLFMAGGFIRACVANETVADIDLFVPDKDLADLVGYKLEGASRYASKNAVTIRLKDERTPPIQIIHRWTYDKPEELIESFDFTVAKSVVWFDGESWQSLIHDHFYADLAAKRLTYTKPLRNEDAGGSMLRVLKFYQKGYRIPLDSLAEVIARLCMGVHQDQLEAMVREGRGDKELALGMVLRGLLFEVDPLLDPQHLFHPPGTADEGDA